MKKKEYDFEELKNERIKDENTKKEIAKAGIGDGIFLLIALFLDGYLVLTSKIGLAIAASVIIVTLYIIYKKYFSKK